MPTNRARVNKVKAFAYGVVSMDKRSGITGSSHYQTGVSNPGHDEFFRLGFEVRSDFHGVGQIRI